MGFLMYRVELKGIFNEKAFARKIMFLMYRVELKAVKLWVLQRE